MLLYVMIVARLRPDPLRFILSFSDDTVYDIMHAILCLLLFVLTSCLWLLLPFRKQNRIVVRIPTMAVTFICIQIIKTVAKE